jgi:hypothetical protein
LDIERQDLQEVEAKLNRQNGLKAAFVVAIWSVPLLALWYWIFQLNDLFAPVMLTLSGAIIGIAVRFHGRGFTRIFSVIAFLAHFAVVVAAFLLGLSLGEGQTVRAVVLFGFYTVGAWSSIYLGRIPIPFIQHKAFYVLTEKTQHPSSKLIKNRWFVVAPLTVVFCGLTMYFTMIALVGVETYRTAQSKYISEQKQRNDLEAKAIDVTPANLETLSDKEAMRYAYAFFKGYLPSRTGRSYSEYPKSEYKAKRILSFLIEERRHTRAKFVLGLLTYDENGTLLIQQAVDEGDIFAKIHGATEFGCYGKTEKATHLLNLLAKTIDDKSAQNEIYSILSTGFERVCEEYKNPDFSVMYIE